MSRKRVLSKHIKDLILDILLIVSNTNFISILNI